MISTQAPKFQFQYGAIKSLPVVFVVKPDGHFNSSMVRLKANPILLSFWFAFWFQFQYGAIKRQCNLLRRCCQKVFQFQYGAIKRQIDDVIDAINDWFQFQYGAIKSWYMR